MARVHLFTSSTQPYNYNRHAHSPDNIGEDLPSLVSEDIINNTTIAEQPRTIEHGAGTVAPSFSSSPEQQHQLHHQQQQESLASQLTTSSAALTAALLQNTHNNNDMVGAVAAALSVKPDALHDVSQQQTNQEGEQSSAGEESKSEEVMDQAAAATALQLLGLSSQAAKASNNNKGKSSMSETQQEDNSAMLMADYSGLTSNFEDIDLDSEEMMQDYKRGPWTREEDELLLAGIRRFGYGHWKKIAITIPGRKGKQLKQRWDNTLAARYVDQEWLKNKIRSEEELHQQQQQQATVGSSPTMVNVNNSNKHDDKALKFLEATDWTDIALKITEKAREGDQHAIEALLSQALLGSVAHASATTTSTANNTASSTTASPHPSHDSVPIQPHDSTANSPKPTTNTTTPTPNNATNNHVTLDLNFARSDPPSINFADAAALAIYAQQISQTNNNGNTSNTNANSPSTLANHTYFLHPFNNNISSSADNNHDVLSAAAAAAVAAVTQQQQQSESSSSTSMPIVGQKRRRSDPALADTQSAAMTIYASAAPITTTVNNQTQTVYPCLFPNCGKTFARLYNLKSHSRTHTDDRPYICHACSAAFSRNHDLKRHSKIHGGDKPYRCEGCKKSFSRLDALKRHKSNQRNKQSCTEQ